MVDLEDTFLTFGGWSHGGVHNEHAISESIYRWKNDGNGGQWLELPITLSEAKRRMVAIKIKPSSVQTCQPEEEVTIVGTAESSFGRASHVASKLIDGKLFWDEGCSYTTESYVDGEIEWWSLELESPQKVTRVQISNRADCCFYRGQNVHISIGTSQVYDPDEPLCLPPIPELSRKPGLHNYFCTGDLHEGKFVKISRAGIMNICEVKVFTALEDSVNLGWYF